MIIMTIMTIMTIIIIIFYTPPLSVPHRSSTSAIHEMSAPDTCHRRRRASEHTAAAPRCGPNRGRGGHHQLDASLDHLGSAELRAHNPAQPKR